MPRFIRFLPYVLKSLWRHRARTALTVSGAAVALFVFCFVGSVQEGLAGLTRGQQAERTLVVFQANRFCPSTSRLPQDYGRTIAKLPGVADVVPIKVFMNNCRASLDLVVFHGLPQDKLRSARDLKLVAGDWGEFEKRQDGALVGRAVAQRRGLASGSKFTIGEVTVTVAGVFASSATEENYIYTHLDFLQRTRGLNSVGTVTQFDVKLAEGAEPQAVAKAIDEQFRGGPIVTDTRSKGVFQAKAVGDLVELIGFANYLGYACVGLVLALVATTTVMAVQDRVREHAVLQTLGFSCYRIFSLVMTESLIVSLVGGVLGIGLAIVVLSFSGMAVGTEGVNIAFTASVGLAGTGLAVSAAVGMLAGLVPAWQAARAEIVASLRHV
ncbi:MAG: FtsX-like permease family protein [Gemmataceae bacterium]|nr:FtsX-like permease family protein [Gemmataceae bacterium]